MAKLWNHNLPDPTTWAPRNATSEELERVFFERCRGVEKLLKLRAEIERQMNIDNFDSGPGVEDIFREELARILPSRYAVRAGVLSNRDGNTAGDCDVLIFNDTWFPSIKAGATEQSRRWHYPIEGVYGALEIKQSLSSGSLDAAMEKLVTCSRLQVESHDLRITENRRPRTAGVTTPPLFTAIVATDISKGEELDDLVQRFVAINGMVKRREVVNALCVLGVGYVTWVIGTAPNARTAWFNSIEDEEELSPLYVREENTCALYELVAFLLQYSHTQVLAAENVVVHYGAQQLGSTPHGAQWNLLPDSRAHERSAPTPPTREAK